MSKLKQESAWFSSIIARCQISDFTETIKMMTKQNSSIALPGMALQVSTAACSQHMTLKRWFDRNAHKLKDYFRITNPIMAGAWHRDGECLPVNLTELTWKGSSTKLQTHETGLITKKNEDLSHTQKQKRNLQVL